MKLVAAVVIVRGIHEIEGKTRRAIDLQLRLLVRPRERPAGVDPRAMEAGDRGESTLPEAGWSDGLQIDEMSEFADLPTELNPGDNVSQSPSRNLLRGRQ
jgi:hypothetical protein